MMRTIIGTALAFLAMAPGIAQAQTEQVFYYHTDAIGSVRMITDSTGQVVGRYDYLPFGEPCGSACGIPSLADKREFAGKEHDQENGFEYFGARFYVGGTGRFTTTDPVLDVTQALVNPQRWNRYAYALNNPLRFVDPRGANADVLCHDQTDSAGNPTTNCTVEVRAQIVFSNKAERDAAERFAKAAKDYWNKQTISGPNGETIRFDVQFNIVRSGSQVSGVDTLIATQGTGQSNVQMTLGPSGGSIPDNGRIYTRDTSGNPSGMAGIAPHETGHLMGLRDLYPPGQPVPGIDSPAWDIMYMAQPRNSAYYAWWVLSPYNGNTTFVRFK